MVAAVGPTPFGAPTFTAPAQTTFTVAPSNSVNHPIMARALYVGVGGNITLVTPDGTVQEFIAVPQGTILPVVSIRVNNTSTTATTMVGLV